MGWSPYLDPESCEHCEEYESTPEFNGYTHNCNPMMRLALAMAKTLDTLGDDHLYALSGMSGAQAHAILAPGIAWWAQNLSSMADLNPDNGWGDSVSAFEFWASISEACGKHPAATLYMVG